MEAVIGMLVCFGAFALFVWACTKMPRSPNDVQLSVEITPVWADLKESSPQPGQLVLMAGKNRDGDWWRDVGVYRGRIDDREHGQHDFRDKYGAISCPTHWQPLPSTPEK